MAWACVGPVDAVPNAAAPPPIAALPLIKLRRLSLFLSSADTESPALFLDILILPLGRIDRDSPDGLRTVVNFCAFRTSRQDSRGVPTATHTADDPNGGRAAIWPFSLAFDAVPPVGCS